MSSKPIPPGVPPSTVTHFQTHPLARSTFSDPNFSIYAMSREITHQGRGHTLMAGTFNTDETIVHLLSFFRRPQPRLQPGGDGGDGTSGNDDDAEIDVRGVRDVGGVKPLDLNPSTRAEVRRFYTFGSGLNAHPDLLHGGVIACLLDSAMGNVIGFALPEVVKSGMFTVQLNTKYEKPVRTPGTVRVRSWIVKVEGGGRKVWVRGVVEGGESGEVRHASAEGMWVSGVRRRRREGGKEEKGGKGDGKL